MSLRVPAVVASCEKDEADLERDDILGVAQDWETFSSAHGLTVPTAPIAVRNLPVEVDPPLQRIYKRLITPFFTPKAVAAYEERTRQLVSGLATATARVGGGARGRRQSPRSRAPALV